MITVMDLYQTPLAHDLAQERSRKAAAPPKLAMGAKSDSESRILISLRASPATSEAALARDTKLNDTAVLLAVRALQDRGLVRKETNNFGGSRLIAVA